MSDSKLLRFINPSSGPVTSIVSVPYPDFWRRTLWHSRALLAPHLTMNPGSKVFDSCGSGWDKDKQKSQSRAVTEAVERWALCHYAQFPEKAGLDIDNTSTGFAALPEDFGIQQVRFNAYCEALERWLLNSIWEQRGVKLEEVVVPKSALSGLFSRFGAKPHLYRVVIGPGDVCAPIPGELVFAYCLLECKEGGGLPGSACGACFETVVDRALAEAYMHLLALDRLKKLDQNDIVDILEKRIMFFGAGPQGFSQVTRKLLFGGNTPGSLKPEVVFSQSLPGPWEPEISIWRVILKDSLPFLSGGVDRFII